MATNLETYIVQVESPNSQISTHRTSTMDLDSWYHSFLPTTIANSIEDTRMVYAYHNVIKGFAAKLSDEELKEMEKKEGFISARPQRVLSLHTTHTPSFLGLQQNMGFWRDSNYGKGVIIGVLDTGIAHDHPSFNDEGMPPPPAKWKGKCEFNSTTCNNKLIGARSFSFAVGVAPLAHLAIYRVCTSVGCSESDILAAMDVAIEDGVDILSLSLGGSSASTLDRNIKATAVLGNKEMFQGESAFQPKDFSSHLYPLVYAGGSNQSDINDPYCSTTSLNKTDLTGKIVLCEVGGGVTRVDKGQAVKAAGGIAMILMNRIQDGFTTSADAHVLPATDVTYADGQKILAYINSTSNPLATITFQGTIIGDKNTPVIASFSSRGPSRATPGILKPDIIGPGIKSAIMTTADTVNLGEKTIQDENHEPANLFAIGSGHVNPSKANDPGLVYDIQPKDYVPYLCGLNYTNREVGVIVQRKINCSEVGSIQQGQLNYPSFSVILGSTSQTYTRTVTNVGEAKSSYTVDVVSPPGVDVKVEPSVLKFAELNQKMSYQVTFTQIVNRSSGTVDVEGFLKWKSTKYSVRSPIAALLTRII
ncbi:hypothetical protein MTR67_053830 [Solanum verrucosum]|uniref:Uncharacterized protein n=1 Tax=Solanum verrucosum TaxID=315347 RepID=A0AAF0V8A7_SOLVR|nr:hypothetical protein MTR67_053830 [Solanum verrucosum]